MKHSATLIEKFLRDECNEAEKQWVKEYIAKHPEALQPYLTEESWHAFQPGQQLPEAIFCSVRLGPNHSEIVFFHRISNVA